MTAAVPGARVKQLEAEACSDGLNVVGGSTVAMIMAQRTTPITPMLIPATGSGRNSGVA